MNFAPLRTALRTALCTAVAAGANPRLDDNLGRSALLEACYHGHDNVIDTLKSAGASLAPPHPSNSASSSAAGRLSTSGSNSSNISGVRSSGSVDKRSGGSKDSTVFADLAAAGSYGSLSVGGSSSSGGVDGSVGGGGGALGQGAEDHIGASWSLQLASLLCNCVYECNLPVRRGTEGHGWWRGWVMVGVHVGCAGVFAASRRQHSRCFKALP